VGSCAGFHCAGLTAGEKGFANLEGNYDDGRERGGAHPFLIDYVPGKGLYLRKKVLSWLHRNCGIAYNLLRISRKE